MKVTLDIRDGRGVLFCGAVEAPSTAEGMIMVLRDLVELRQRPLARLLAKAMPVPETVNREARG